MRDIYRHRGMLACQNGQSRDIAARAIPRKYRDHFKSGFNAEMVSKAKKVQGLIASGINHSNLPINEAENG
jgi:hypothetical protein